MVDQINRKPHQKGKIELLLQLCMTKIVTTFNTMAVLVRKLLKIKSAIMVERRSLVSTLEE